MKRHEISEADIEKYIADLMERRVSVASSFGDGTNKIFEMTLVGDCYVIDHGEEIYSGDNLGEAIEAYNNAP